MRSSDELESYQQNNENTEDECADSYTQTEKSNSNTQKDDETEDKAPDSPVQTSPSNKREYIQRKRELSKSNAEKTNSNTQKDDETEDKAPDSPVQTSPSNKGEYFQRKRKLSESSADLEENVEQSRIVSSERIYLNKTNEGDFACHICTRRFRTNARLEIHLRYHTKDRMYLCDKCGKAYTTNYYLRQHIREMHENNRYPCESCNKTFRRKKDLYYHELTHKGCKTNCPVCKEAFSYRYNMLKHYKNEHSTSDPYLRQYFKCDKCEKYFSSKYNLKEHNSTVHSTEKPHLCQDCGTSFRLKRDLHNHKKYEQYCKDLQTSTSRATFQYKCNYCTGRFTLERDLLRHKIIHKFPCHICYRIWIKYQIFLKHMTIHENKGYDPPERCLNCNESFNCSWDTWRNHKCKEKKNSEEMPYKCQCGCSFKTIYKLNNHVKKRLDECGECQYKCDHCTGIFILERDLQRHKKLHTDDKKNKCDKCSESFSSKDEFDKHNCKQSEKNPSSLIQQRDNDSELEIGSESHKSDEFTCQICNEILIKTQIDDYFAHMEFHEKNNDDPPESCSYCNNSCNRSWDTWTAHLSNCKGKDKDDENSEKMSHKCECGCSFKTVEELIIHKLSSSFAACHPDVADSD